MKTNCSTIPKLSDFGIEPNKGLSGQQMVAYWTALQQWHTAFEMELLAKLGKNNAALDFIKNKKDLIHNTMKLNAMAENDLITEILGSELVASLHKEDKNMEVKK